jgi:hypothetical protein
MAPDSNIDEYVERQESLQGRLDEIGATLHGLLAASPGDDPGSAAAQIEALLREQEQSFRDSRQHAIAFVAQLRKLEAGRKREEARKLAEEQARETEPAMTEKRSSPPRDQARIEKLSEELSLNLRLERVDDAIKEVLSFIADTEFFAANASTGRKRRLRSLENAIHKALAA